MLLAYAKSRLYDELLASDLPDDPPRSTDCSALLPGAAARALRAGRSPRHRLRREIIATLGRQQLVNRVGLTFVHQLKDRTGMPPSEVARAYVVARDVFGLRPLWGAIEGLTLPDSPDRAVPAEVQYRMLLECGRALERGTAWFLGQRHAGIDVRALIAAFGPGIGELAGKLDGLLGATDLQLRGGQVADLVRAGAPPALAERVASLPWLPALCDIVAIAHAVATPAAQVGQTYFRIGARFGFDQLRWAAGRISTDKTWNKLAVSAIIDDLYGQQAELTSRVLQAAQAAKGGAESSLEAWVEARRPVVARAEQLLAELRATPEPDLAMLTVASRALKAVGV